ncbi:hypothetical protein [Phaeobacter sp. HF9A]|uniref:hypothetical protein n=1 Tax=Phaeobacter sp. HF9A TaxID=2721561 RepID=UPI001432048C|nr:hypothetical protein [Phaeobacter sp. HF9A]NIZ12445.1 hypothetical protein [Phaeobacter sp. HF9A]
MTAVIELPRGARDQVLVFALDMPPEQARFLRDEPGALAQVLGLETQGLQPDMEQVEIFPVSDLEELGLLGYLHDGLGVSEDDLSAQGMALDGISGWVLILRARAFDATLQHSDVRLVPAQSLHLVARLGEIKTDWSAQGLIPSAAAQPSFDRSPRAARNRARRIGATLFAAVMLLLCLLIWVIAT